jgi:hypothetical protein
MRVLSALLLLTTGAVAAPPDPAVDPARVTALVAQLGSPDYRAREKAGRDLLALGDRALPALKAALPTLADPEANRRLQVIVARLDAERLRAPRRVTLKVVNKKPEDVLDEIARQTGYKIDYDARERTVDRRVSLDFADLPFWEALDRVCDAAELTVKEMNEDGTVGVYYYDNFSPHVCYDGPFKVIATNFNSGRGLQLSGLSRKQPSPRQPEYLSLNLSVQSEPKAPVVGIGNPTVTKAIDDRGVSLVPVGESPDAPHESLYLGASPMFRSFNTNFGIGLVRSDRSAETLKEIRGKVPVQLLADTRPEVVVPDLLTVKKQRFTGRSVELEVASVDFRNDLLTLELQFRRRAGDPDDYTWLNTLAARVEVLDAAGAKLRPNGVTNQTNGPGVCGMTVQFTVPGGPTKVGKPATLQFVEWVTVTREVNFVLKDVPLP